MNTAVRKGLKARHAQSEREGVIAISKRYPIPIAVKSSRQERWKCLISWEAEAYGNRTHPPGA
jgi:hypothetical protein